MTEKLTLDDVAHFTWSLCGHPFFLETAKGNFEWSDSEYPGGDDSIKKFNGTYKDWCEKIGIPFGRDKGEHTIRGYCGKNVKIVQD